MKHVETSFWMRGVCRIAILGAMAVTANIQAQRLPASKSIEEVAERSDAIFVADVVEKKAEFRDGRIITSYRMKPKEIWKGSLPTESDGLATLEEIGGILDGPVPLAQTTNITTTMVPGEEVLLFTKKFKQDPKYAAYGGKPAFTEGKLVFFNRKMGRYSVLTDSRTGKRHVIKPNLNARGIVADNMAFQRYLDGKTKELEAKKQAAANKPPGGGNSEPTAGIAEFESLDAVRERVQAHLNKKASEGASANN
jgi:hypothetical protein